MNYQNIYNQIITRGIPLNRQNYVMTEETRTKLSTAVTQWWSNRRLS